MNITFLVGNGFDLNLGLSTTYAAFINFYKKTDSRTEVIREFKKHIEENEQLWSDAEIALGKSTERFKKGQGKEFSECHRDFCEKLSLYLTEQQNRINCENHNASIQKAFSNINKIAESFPLQERESLNQVIRAHASEVTKFNFICFNYTDTLERCLDGVKNEVEVWGNHSYGSGVKRHRFGGFWNVHGTVKSNMVFGVHDDSQIAKLDVFDCENGDIYKNFLIKKQTNELYAENVDANVNQIIEDSHIIYVYGMSIGNTDKLWWDRICKWLSAGSARHLIVQQYVMPSRGVFPVSYQLAERQVKREVTKHCNLNEEDKKRIENRMHITSANIFSDISGIAANAVEDSI